MLTLSSSSVRKFRALKGIAIMFAAWVLGTVACAAASEETVTVRQIGPLDSVIADRILGQVHALPFPLEQASPMLLQGTTLSRLRHRHTQELQAAYQAGHTIVLLDATLEQITALHGIIGAGVIYRSQDGEGVLAYALRQENHIPTATLVAHVHPSPLHLQTPSGDPDPTGLQDEARAFDRAADRTVRELRHLPQVSVPGPRDASQSTTWQDNPQQTFNFNDNQPEGVFNTFISVYALYSCMDSTDRYVVTALADWSATHAHWESASTELGDSSLYYDTVNDDYKVANWMDDPNLTYCSSHSFNIFSTDANVCRYINYPLSYEVDMQPSDPGAQQINAAPAGTQGQQTTYQSGFSFSIGGTVNVSGMGPGAGISVGANWTNTTSTTVPPLIVESGKIGPGDIGQQWTFKYCTNGAEPDPDTNCTSHVQTIERRCRDQLGDFSGTNPQQGQTPQGTFSDAVQSAYWLKDSTMRMGSTFDITVNFTADIAYTTAYLWGSQTEARSHATCSLNNCDCSSITTLFPVVRSHVFQIPFPSTKCD